MVSKSPGDGPLRMGTQQEAICVCVDVHSFPGSSAGKESAFTKMFTKNTHEKNGHKKDTKRCSQKKKKKTMLPTTKEHSIIRQSRYLILWTCSFFSQPLWCFFNGLRNKVVTVADMEVSSPVAKSTSVTEVYVIEPVHVFNTATAETTAEPQIWHCFKGDHSVTWSDHMEVLYPHFSR